MANEFLRQPLYDSIKLTTGTQAVGTLGEFFTTPKGQSSKTILDTNITTAGQLPYAEARVIGLRLHAVARTVTAPITVGDLNGILACTSLTLKKEDRVILEVPSFMIPSGYGLNGFASTTASATTISTANNGEPHRSNFFELLSSEQFLQRDRLQVTLNTNVAFTTTADLYLYVVLEASITKSYY